MKRLLLCIMVVFVVFMASGCGQQKMSFAGLSLGMSDKDVYKIKGKPSIFYDTTEMRVIGYDVSGNHLFVYLNRNNNEVTAIRTDSAYYFIEDFQVGETFDMKEHSSNSVVSFEQASPFTVSYHPSGYAPYKITVWQDSSKRITQIELSSK